MAGSLVGQAANARSLQPDAVAALQQAGITGVDVTFKGREAYLSSTTATAAELDKAKSVVESVYGVRWARIEGGAGGTPTPSPGTTASAQPFSFSIGQTGGNWSASGNVPSAAAVQDVLTRSSTVFGAPVADKLTPGAGVTLPSWWGALGQAMGKFPPISGGGLTADDQGITLTGAVADMAAYNQLKDAVAGAPYTVMNHVNVDPAIKISSGANGVTLTGAVASQAEADALVAQATRVFGGPVNNQLTIQPECAGSAWFGGFMTALGGLPPIAGGSLTASAAGLSLDGTVGNEADVATVTAALATVPLPSTNHVTVPPPLTAAQIAQINSTVVNFADGVYDLDDQATAKLAQVLPLLKQAKGPIEIRGYVSEPHPEDRVGTDSAARAQAVANYLSANGIDAARLVVIGAGAADPVGDNGTPEGRYANQRATLTIKEG